MFDAITEWDNLWEAFRLAARGKRRKGSAASKHALWGWKRAIIDRLARERLTIHETQAQVLPTRCGIPWLGFVVFPTHRLLKQRNAVNFSRRFERNIARYRDREMSFAELTVSVQGWVNHVRYADTWGLREHVFASHPVRRTGPSPDPSPPRGEGSRAGGTE